MTAGAAGDTAVTRAAAKASGAELAGLGFTVDFAPDRDVTAGPSDPTIGSRSASSDPEVVTHQADAASRGFSDCRRHPGRQALPRPRLGRRQQPLHAAGADQDPEAELRSSDLVPFADAVDEAAPAVMTAHLDVRAVDPGVPSSLSRKVVTGLLRHDLGFRGLTVTDALNMGAVTNDYDSAHAAVRALQGGRGRAADAGQPGRRPARDRGRGPRRPARAVAPRPGRDPAGRAAAAPARRGRAPGPARLRPRRLAPAVGRRHHRGEGRLLRPAGRPEGPGQRRRHRGRPVPGRGPRRRTDGRPAPGYDGPAGALRRRPREGRRGRRHRHPLRPRPQPREGRRSRRTARRRAPCARWWTC